MFAVLPCDQIVDRDHAMTFRQQTDRSNAIPKAGPAGNNGNRLADSLAGIARLSSGCVRKISSESGK